MSSRWMVNRSFTRQFATGGRLPWEVDTEQAGKTANMWKKIFFFVAVPAIGLGMLNCYLKEKEEREHHVRPPFVPYEHLRIRTKRYPWGDGTRTFFHNPKVNALPTGYEDEQ